MSTGQRKIRRCIGETWRRFLQISVACGLALAMAGCHQTPKPDTLAIPAMQVQSTHFLGSPLAGSQSITAANLQGIDTATLSDFYLVDIELFGTATLPPEADILLGSRASLIATPQGQLPVSANLRQARGVRLAEGKSASALRASLQSAPKLQVVPIDTLHGGVLPGVTCSLTANFPASGLASPKLSFLIYRPLPVATTQPATRSAANRRSGINPGSDADSATVAPPEASSLAAEMNDLPSVIVAKPAATEPSNTTQSATTQPVTTQPITTQSVTTHPVSTQPIATQSATTQPDAPTSIASTSMASDSYESAHETIVIPYSVIHPVASQPIGTTTQSVVIATPSTEPFAPTTQATTEPSATTQHAGPTTRPTKPFMDIGTRSPREGSRQVQTADYQLGIELDDYATTAGTSAAPRDELGQELVLVSFPQPPTDTEDLAVCIPLNGLPNQAKYLVACIQVRRVGPTTSGGNATADAALFLMKQQIQQSANAASSQPSGYSAAPSDRAALASAMSVLAQPVPRRAALVYLAGRTGATLSSELALSAADVQLAAYAKQLSDSGAATALDRSPADLGWTMDLAALTYLTQLASEEKLPAELDAVLTTYAGEVGRHSGTLQVILNNLRSRQELDLRLLAENRIYLEDPSPAARVRASDWLRARNRLPAGYDPLARGTERRAALEAAARQPAKP